MGYARMPASVGMSSSNCPALIPSTTTSADGIFLDTLLASAYPRARRQAAKDTGLPLARFPETCPWSVEQLLDQDFWPDISVIGDLDA